MGKIINCDVWENVKQEIKDFTIDYSKKKAKIKNKTIQHLHKLYRDTWTQSKNNPEKFKDQMAAIKEQIAQLHLDMHRGTLIRSKSLYLDNQEKPSRYFLKTETTHGQNKHIKEINHNNTKITTSEKILDTFKDYYETLFTKEPINEMLLPEFLENLPNLSDESKEICEGPITYSECLQTLKQMKNNKSPGPDGLTKEFYLHFFTLLGPVYIIIMNQNFENGKLTPSQRLGYITLICKDPQKAEHMTNWRPISLLNIDYKIVSKTLTNRLNQVISELVYTDQTCAVPGRSILDNTHLLRSVVDYIDQKPSYCGILSLDQQKAFDRVDHSFLFACLEKYGFGDTFTQWVKLLYTDIYSSVIVNQLISTAFPVTRSVRQGCSLSPLLYILTLEPFLRKMMNDKDIQGLSIPGATHTLKYTAFADDINTFFTTEKSIKQTLHLSYLYSQVSGSKLNLTKTKGIWLGKWSTRSDHPFGISWIDSHKLYGIYFGNVDKSYDNWNRIFQKFIKSLNNHRQRHISMQGKATIIHTLACSKLWYTGSVLNISSSYMTQFQRAIYYFLYNTSIEPIQRTVVTNRIEDGG